MKKILFVFMSILAFAAINNEAAAQSVSFGNDVYSNGTNTLNANVYCSEAATVTFEIQTSLLSSGKGGSAFYYINGVLYYTYPTSGKVIYYMTVDLPAGSSSVKIDAFGTHAVILLNAINGKSATTRPISFRPVN